MESLVQTVPAVYQAYIYIMVIAGMFVHNLRIQIHLFHSANLVMVIAISALDQQ
jgi:hypothetical protein